MQTFFHVAKGFPGRLNIRKKIISRIFQSMIGVLHILLRILYVLDFFHLSGTKRHHLKLQAFKAEGIASHLDIKAVFLSRKQDKHDLLLLSECYDLRLLRL